MQKLMIVVAILITNYQLSLKRNKDPNSSPTRMVVKAKVKVIGRPVLRGTCCAKSANHTALESILALRLSVISR